MVNNEYPIIMKPELKNLEVSLILGRASVIYADENFNVYFTVKNITKEPLYIWLFGILATTDFIFTKSHTLEAALPPKETIIKRLEKFILLLPQKFDGFIFYILSFRLSGKKAYADYKKLKEQLEKPLIQAPIPASKIEEYTEGIDEKLTQDYLKEYYVEKGAIPWKLSPGEASTDIFIGKTNQSLFFRPDKYKLNLYVDYSNDKKEFFRETKVEEVDILASIKSLIFGATLGGFIGGILVRIFAAQDFSLLVRILATKATQQDISLIGINLFGIFGAIMMSILTVIALSRRSSAQTLVTIQDFWGGFFIGFLVGYSGKIFFEKIIGIT